MKSLLITGVCGFVGATLARCFLERRKDLHIWGIDNFCRDGSRRNVATLGALGVRIVEGDTRSPDIYTTVPPVDWVIDCAAEPSVLAGVSGSVSPFDVMDNNLVGTIRQLEFCRTTGAGFILMSTSRVYSVRPLSLLRVSEVNRAYRPEGGPPVPGLSASGISEAFSTDPPLSLYGVSKRTSELIAIEYGDAFGFPVWINRCGVLAGQGQFGKSDQGIVSFWIKSWRDGRPLKFIGFDGGGYQVRDCLHPADLADVLLRQCDGKTPDQWEAAIDYRICNFSGGVNNSFSLAQLSDWCSRRFGTRTVDADPVPRAYDLPWVVLDHSKATRAWGWVPSTPLGKIFEEIAAEP